MLASVMYCRREDECFTLHQREILGFLKYSSLISEKAAQLCLFEDVGHGGQEDTLTDKSIPGRRLSEVPIDVSTVQEQIEIGWKWSW